MGSRWSRAAFWIALFASSASCKGVLGLDAPELDPCSASPTGCDEAGADSGVDSVAPPNDAAQSDAHDSAIDQGPVHGLPCGASGAALLGCEGATPICCQSNGTFTCVHSASSCDGFAIGCTRNDNCSGSDVCCRGKSTIECTGEPDCNDTALICDPSGSDSQCPNGWSCSAAVSNDGVTLPYHACAH